MQVKIITAAKPRDFEPFDVVIRVESAEEAQVLWHRFNLSWALIKKMSRDENMPLPEIIDPLHVWTAVDEECTRQGLRRY